MYEVKVGEENEFNRKSQGVHRFKQPGEKRCGELDYFYLDLRSRFGLS